MTKLHKLLSSVVIFTSLTVSCILSSLATKPAINYNLSDNIPIPMSPREENEFKENGYITSAIRVKSITKNEKEIVLKGTLDRGVAALNEVDKQIADPQLHLELRTSEKLPEEITNGEDVSNCILRGAIHGDISTSNIIIFGKSLLCNGHKTIKTKAFWRDINNKVAVEGMVVRLGIEKSEPIESSKKTPSNSEFNKHTEELERLLKIYNKNIPVIFVPRETNVEIVFPIEKN